MTTSVPDTTLRAEIGPTVARGANLVAVRPPTAGYAGAAVAALTPHAPGPGLRLLVLASDAMLDSVGHMVAREWHPAGGVLHTARRAGRAITLIHREALTALVTTPSTAAALLRRSSLPLAGAPSVLLAWPETWDEDASLVDLMQDLPAEAQRLLYTADLHQAEELGERYLRKALVLGTPASGKTWPSVDRPVGVTVAPADRLGQAVLDVVDAMDARGGAVWTAIEETEAAVRRALEGAPVEFSVVRGSVPTSSLVIAADLPTPETLAQLAGAAQQLVVVTPAWGLPYLAAHASAVRGLRRPGTVEDAHNELAKHRSQIEAALGKHHGDLDRAVYALTPLFERHDPAMVAGALYQMWTATQPQLEPGMPGSTGPQPAPPPGSPGRSASGRSAKIFVTVGRKDGATPADFVATLTKDLGVPRQAIGKIDLRETYSLIELPADSAERIAEGLTGMSIRRRKVTARLDRARR